jgi:REP-associated tyrosine transposase
MAEELDRFGVDVLAWFLMTNHTHLIIAPSDSKVMARDRRSAPAVHTHEELSDEVRGYLFQGRFGSCILDERHLLAGEALVSGRTRVDELPK